MHAYMAAQQIAVTGELAKALDSYRAALAADPDFEEARATLGVVLYTLGQRAFATTELERAFAHPERMPERRRLTMLGDYFGAMAFSPRMTALAIESEQS